MASGLGCDENREKAMITITAIVGSSGKYLVTGIPIDTESHALLKMTFENKTGGTNLGLYAGTAAEFNSGTGGTQLSDSGGPGFIFLTIIDRKDELRVGATDRAANEDDLPRKAYQGARPGAQVGAEAQPGGHD
jgi:hypothetical protein